jgi:phospholipase/carboxylesterase
VIRNRVRRHLIAIICGAGALGVGLAWVLLRRPPPRLRTVVSGGAGPPTLVLLHGYGSSAEQWAPFTKTIWLPPGGRFVFPQAPETTAPPDGPAEGRAWWKLELAAHIRPGGSLPDLSATSPPGIKTAATLVREVLQDTRGTVVLGGFSQGAMVASEVAFMSDVPMRALVLLSGTMVDEAAWTEHFSRRRGLPVFLSHGRSDDVLPFATAERLRHKLEAAGTVVTWCPFEGGHEIPAEVVIALNAFLRGLRLVE